MSVQDVWVNIFTGAVTGILTAGIGVRFALRQFRSERTWERKAAAYSEVFDSLYHVLRFTKMELRRVEGGAQFDDAYAKLLGEQATAGYDAIRKAAIKGTFVVVGRASAQRLNELVDDFDDPHHNADWHEEISADHAAVTSAIEDLRKLAVKDLSH